MCQTECNTLQKKFVDFSLKAHRDSYPILLVRIIQNRSFELIKLDTAPRHPDHWSSKFSPFLKLWTGYNALHQLTSSSAHFFISTVDNCGIVSVVFIWYHGYSTRFASVYPSTTSRPVALLTMQQLYLVSISQQQLYESSFGLARTKMHNIYHPTKQTTGPCSFYFVTISRRLLIHGLESPYSIRIS